MRANPRGCHAITFFFFLCFPFELFSRFLLAMVKRKRNFVRRTRFGGESMGKRRKMSRRIMPVKIIKTRRRRNTKILKTGIVPDKLRVRMRYFFKFDLDISAIGQDFVFRANGCFDPEVTGVGGQPRGFDQYATLYDRYVVTSSKITINAFSPTNAQPFMLSVRAHDSGVSSDANSADVVELPGNSFSLAPAFDNTRKKVVTSVNVAKFYNRSGGVQDDDDLVAGFTVDPTTQIRYTVTAIPEGTSAGGDVRIMGWIDYRVMLLEPKKVGAS